MNKSRLLLASILVFPLYVSAVPTYTEIFSYPFTGQPGCNPSSKPLEGSDGALYGTTARTLAAVPAVGPDGAGLLYRINKDGTDYAVLHFFEGSTSPNATALIEAADGALWGTTGDNYSGTIYKLNLDGSGFTTVHAVSAPPRGALLEASDGAIYGAA